MKILIIDFGSRFTNNVIEAIAKLHMEYDCFDYNISIEIIKEYDGIILTGSYDTIYDGGRVADKELLNLGIPVLGICYGHQFVHHMLGGKVVRAKYPEDGIFEIETDESKIFKDLPRKHKVEMHHNDEVIELADNFKCIARTENCLIAASENPDKNIYTVQYHPEANGNDYGIEVFKNFIDIVYEEKKKIKKES